MIQNVLLTSFTPLKNKNENDCWENRPFTTVWPENIQRKTRDITRTIKKKQKRVRTAFSTDQLRSLERAYIRHKYIDSEKRAELAKSLNIGDKCVKIWFQNRRMKEKRASSESCSDSSSESVSNETPSLPASPPLHITPDLLQSDHLNKFPQYSEHAYQLPTYYNTNHIQPGYDISGYTPYFYTDNNVYPTQYYPFDANYPNGNDDGNGFNQYGSEINCWASNHYTPYYSAM